MSFTHHPPSAAIQGGGDDPLKNLSAIRTRMDNLHRYLADSVNAQIVPNQFQIDSVNAEISSAIHQVILNAAALLSPPPPLPNPAHVPNPDLQPQKAEAADDPDDIVEIDAVELLAEHVHFCDVCGKGFKRDANLRMHMRAHGNQFKTVEALTKPAKAAAAAADRKGTRFSCPYAGCNRNKGHKKFRPLKSVVCVKNHFKRSHCPKMYSCDRCSKKSFSVVADLRSHLKHCGGESRWRCSCGTTFSRKDKLFGHMALFEGHMPAVAGDESKSRGRDGAVDDDGSGFFDGLEDGFFGSVDGLFGMDGDGYGMMMMGGSSGLGGGGGGGMDEFFEF